MPLHTRGFALAVTHVFKGVVRTTRSYTATGEKAAPVWRRDTLNERKRQQQILERLYAEYAAGGHDDPHVNGYLPPDAWTNKRLDELLESWRVHNVDGFRCEIYDLASSSTQ